MIFLIVTFCVDPSFSPERFSEEMSDAKFTVVGRFVRHSIQSCTLSWAALRLNRLCCVLVRCGCSDQKTRPLIENGASIAVDWSNRVSQSWLGEFPWNQL